MRDAPGLLVAFGFSPALGAREYLATMLTPPAAILEALRARSRLLLVTHARPDGDALGSMLGLRLALLAMHKRVGVFLRDSMPHPYGFLPGAGEIQTAACAPADYESVVIVECSSLARSHLAGLERLPSINIDHHASGRSFATLNWIEPTACATAEMVYWLIRALPVALSPEIATCLYAGVLADTGGFIYSNTSARTLSLGAELARLGADPHGIAATMFMSYRQTKMRVLACALSHLRIEPPLAWMWVTAEEMQRLGASWEDAEGLVNYALGMEGIAVAAFFRPAGPGRQRASLRSKGLLDVAAIAESFGGGGHAQASGFSHAGELDAVREVVLGRLRRELAAQSNGRGAAADSP